MLGDERGKLDRHLLMPAEQQIRLDPILDGGHARILESSDGRLREGVVLEARKCGAAPHTQSLRKSLRRGLRVPAVERVPPQFGQRSESVGIKLVGSDAQFISGWARDEDL